jgi:two-component system, OmpR family, response regulator RpaB
MAENARPRRRFPVMRGLRAADTVGSDPQSGARALTDGGQDLGDDMVTTSAVETPLAVLVLDARAQTGEPLAPALTEHGLAPAEVRLTADEPLPAMEVAAVLVRADALTQATLTTAQQLREAHRLAPVILWAPFQAQRLEEALMGGFDLWVPSESSAAAVAAQVQAVCRLVAGTARQILPDQVTVRGVTMDFARAEVTAAGRLVPLTPTEFRILARLFRAPGRVVSHADLFREVHGYEASEQEAKDILKVHMSRLRTKLSGTIGADDLIVTVRGFGYLLERRSVSARENDEA